MRSWDEPQSHCMEWSVCKITFLIEHGKHQKSISAQMYPWETLQSWDTKQITPRTEDVRNIMGLQTNLRLSFDELSCSTDSKNNSFQVYDGDSTSMCPSFRRPVNKLFTEDQDQIVF